MLQKTRWRTVRGIARAGMLEGSIAAPGGGFIAAGGRVARLLASYARAVTPGTLREASGHVRSHALRGWRAAAPSWCPYVLSLLTGVRLTLG